MVDIVTKSESLCKCCLNENGLRDMWAGYISSNTGEFEIYGQMISDCFNLPWSPPEDDTTQDLICDSCIERVRLSYDFKKEIISAYELLTEAENDIKYHAEYIDDSSPIDDSFPNDDSLPNDDGVEIKEEKYPEEEWLTENLMEEPEAEYENVEYLEDDSECKPGSISDSDSDDSMPNYKQTKKRKGEKRYKNYTDNDLKKAIAAVRNKTMTVTMAYRTYNLPRSTLRFKLNEKEEASPTSDVHSTFIKEVQTILKFTNATPFKSRTAKLYCLYCTEGQVYETPEELRNHINTKHIRHRIRHIEHIMRPAFNFEILRIDIYNLSCTVCCETLESWDDMYTHLEEQHNTTFEYAPKKLIPYILTDQNYICAKCNKIFKSYYHLDIHMNNHFKNHLCLECGDSYMSESRLKKHLKTHEKGHFPCEICGVSFTLENYRKKHYDYLHAKTNKLKCHYCNERFQGEYARHLHVVEKHEEKVKNYTCSVCEKNFTWRAYYIKHIKRAHNKTKVYNCEICQLKFDNAKARREHNAKTHKNLSTPKSNIKILRKANDELVRKYKKSDGEINEELLADAKKYNNYTFK